MQYFTGSKEHNILVRSRALKLGLTSFGGPIAHLGYFRAEYVERKKWIEDRVYADLVALCQFTPGPASSKVGIGIGLVGAFAVGKLLQAGLIGTSPSDPLTLAVIVVLLATVFVLACLLPARRAARLDPVVVLRYD